MRPFCSMKLFSVTRPSLKNGQSPYLKRCRADSVLAAYITESGCTTEGSFTLSIWHTKSILLCFSLGERHQHKDATMPLNITMESHVFPLFRTRPIHYSSTVVHFLSTRPPLYTTRPVLGTMPQPPGKGIEHHYPGPKISELKGNCAGKDHFGYCTSYQNLCQVCGYQHLKIERCPKCKEAAAVSIISQPRDLSNLA